MTQSTRSILQFFKPLSKKLQKDDQKENDQQQNAENEKANEDSEQKATLHQPKRSSSNPQNTVSILSFFKLNKEVESTKDPLPNENEQKSLDEAISQESQNEKSSVEQIIKKPKQKRKRVTRKISFEDNDREFKTNALINSETAQKQHTDESTEDSLSERRYNTRRHTQLPLPMYDSEDDDSFFDSFIYPHGRFRTEENDQNEDDYRNSSKKKTTNETKQLSSEDKSSPNEKAENKSAQVEQKEKFDTAAILRSIFAKERSSNHIQKTQWERRLFGEEDDEQCFHYYYSPPIDDDQSGVNIGHREMKRRDDSYLSPTSHVPILPNNQALTNSLNDTETEQVRMQSTNFSLHQLPFHRMLKEKKEGGLNEITFKNQQSVQPRLSPNTVVNKCVKHLMFNAPSSSSASQNSSSKEDENESLFVSFPVDHRAYCFDSKTFQKHITNPRIKCKEHLEIENATTSSSSSSSSATTEDSDDDLFDEKTNFNALFQTPLHTSLPESFNVTSHSQDFLHSSQETVSLCLSPFSLTPPPMLSSSQTNSDSFFPSLSASSESSSVSISISPQSSSSSSFPSSSASSSVSEPFPSFSTSSPSSSSASSSSSFPSLSPPSSSTTFSEQTSTSSKMLFDKAADTLIKMSQNPSSLNELTNTQSNSSIEQDNKEASSSINLTFNQPSAELFKIVSIVKEDNDSPSQSPSPSFSPFFSPFDSPASSSIDSTQPSYPTQPASQTNPTSDSQTQKTAVSDFSESFYSTLFEMEDEAAIERLAQEDYPNERELRGRRVKTHPKPKASAKRQTRRSSASLSPSSSSIVSSITLRSSRNASSSFSPLTSTSSSSSSSSSFSPSFSPSRRTSRSTSSTPTASQEPTYDTAFMDKRQKILDISDGCELTSLYCFAGSEGTISFIPILAEENNFDAFDRAMSFHAHDRWVSGVRIVDTQTHNAMKKLSNSSFLTDLYLEERNPVLSPVLNAKAEAMDGAVLNSSMFSSSYALQSSVFSCEEAHSSQSSYLSPSLHQSVSSFPSFSSSSSSSSFSSSKHTNAFDSSSSLSPSPVFIVSSADSGDVALWDVRDIIKTAKNKVRSRVSPPLRPKAKPKTTDDFAYYLGDVTPACRSFEHSAGVYTLDYLPRMGMLTGSKDCSAIIWDINCAGSGSSMAVVRRFSTLHKGTVKSVCFHPESSLFASSGNDRTIKIVDTRSKDYLANEIEEAHKNVVNSVVWSPLNSSFLISSSFDMTFKLWDTRMINPDSPICTLDRHYPVIPANTRQFTNPVFICDNLVLATLGDRSICYYDLEAAQNGQCKLLKRMRLEKEATNFYSLGFNLTFQGEDNEALKATKDLDLLAFSSTSISLRFTKF